MDELRDKIIEYYNSHSREETLAKFCLTTKRFYKILDGYKKPKDSIIYKNTRSHESYINGGKKSAKTQKENWELKTEQEKIDWRIKCKDSQLNMSDEQKKNKVNKYKQTFSKKSTEEKLLDNKKRSDSCKEYWDNLTTEIKQDIIDNQLEKTRETCLEKYGVPYNCMRDEARLKGNNSQVNQQFENILIINKLDYSREFVLDNYSYDFKVDKTLIELNPYYTHNSTFNPFGRDCLAKDYHFNKTKTSIENGYKCINVWDWDNIDKIIAFLKPKEHLYARQLEIREINDDKSVAEFENLNHIQGYCKGQKICLGLYLNDNLIELMTFGKPRYNSNYEYELLRLCTSSQYTVTGGANKLYKYFIEKYAPISIISYCDNSKFDGKVYESLGFTLLSYGAPSKHWYNSKTQVHITDNLLRQRGFDQLFGKEYGCFGKGTNNTELMIAHGFVEIYDCGQKTFVWANK